MDEVDEFSQQLMLDFLQMNFPIKRLKDGRRFKRGVKVESEWSSVGEQKLFLKPQSELTALYAILGNTLDSVFGFSQLEINVVLFKYLNIH